MTIYLDERTSLNVISPSIGMDVFLQVKMMMIFGADNVARGIILNTARLHVWGTSQPETMSAKPVMGHLPA